MLANVFHTWSLALLAAGLFATATQAQSLNIDFDSSSPVQGPTPATYGAAGSAGVWNQLTATSSGPYGLVDLSGAPAGVSLTLPAGGVSSLEFANGNITGDHEFLMHDFLYAGAGPLDLTFTGLADGTYTVYTYALASNNKAGFWTVADVSGATTGPQVVGGSFWQGAHVLGASYAKHTASVSGGTLVVNVDLALKFLIINGIQLEYGGPVGTPYCFGDGSGAACPCGNTGGAGEGCANSAGSGATLSGSGVAGAGVNDTLALDVVGVPGAKPGLLLRGDNQTTVMMGGGLLCVGTNTQRAQVQVTNLGATTFHNWNGAGFRSISNLGAPTHFQFWYRDPNSACAGTDFNFSNGFSVTYP